ncbi:drug/metabolite transporter (DMT)-like permease [Paramicrobacterium agarici]|uniref:Drug/metabolite transporter (DMT)-like permease n=2 Tax=Paramicrobacterium agarici TaxID=630514 RepID=A0A2A9DRN3_9MICO|nr:drug/metabolite transporter (DMT)-like permease [Microbacterium agarici]
MCLSASAILVKLAGVDAATTAVLRCAIAVLFLVPLALGERGRRGPLSRRGISWALAAGVALGIDYAAWTASIFSVGAGISTVLVNVQVVVLPLLAFVVDRERMRLRFLLTLPLMLFGICLVGGVWGAATLREEAVRGTLLGLLAGLGYGSYLFLTRRATRQEPGRMVQPLAWATASAAVTAALIAPFTGGLHLKAITPLAWTYLVLLAVLGQIVAWLLIHRGSTHLDPVTTAALLLIQPVLALGLSAMILAERPTTLQLVGATIVIAAVAISNGLVGGHRRTKDAVFDRFRRTGRLRS